MEYNKELRLLIDKGMTKEQAQEVIVEDEIAREMDGDIDIYDLINAT